jgi:flagellar hook-associated protein 1 FlgK
MLSFFATLNLGTRALQADRQGAEVAGHNLANVNNPAYSRQRVNIQSTLPLPTAIGPQGTGAEVTSIQQIRDAFIDRQIVTETSVGSYLDAQQKGLQYAQAALGEQIDTSTSGAQATTPAGGAQAGLAASLNDLFSSFQSLSVSPSSLTERQTLIARAQTLAGRFNQVDQRMDTLQQDLDTNLNDDVSKVNQDLKDIAQLNDGIVRSELGGGEANDLRDLRQQKIEDLAGLADLKSTTEANGSVTITLGGQTLVSNKQVLDTLETYDSGGGRLLLRTATGQAPLTLTGGSLQGTIDLRDGSLTTLRGNLNQVASTLITQVNDLHAAGFSLTGSTGANFFEGTDAGTIKVNDALAQDPRLLQASGVNGQSGDNTVALQLAQLSTTRVAALGGQTIGEKYAQTVTGLGLDLSTIDGRINDQGTVQNLLTSQRESVSGVSLDEEMADLIKFQRSFEASAHLLKVIDGLLGEVVNLKP